MHLAAGGGLVSLRITGKEIKMTLNLYVKYRDHNPQQLGLSRELNEIFYEKGPTTMPGS